MVEQYVKIPEQHIVIDFDFPDENGGKSQKWNGVHLHYIYNGDVSKLQRVNDKRIKVAGTADE